MFKTTQSTNTNSIPTNNIVKGSMSVVAAAPKENFLVNFLLGGISATIAKTTVAPTERVKLILQTQSNSARAFKNPRQYNGITDCLQKVVKYEGFKSLWKGNGINVIKIFPMNALNLALKDLFGKFIRV